MSTALAPNSANLFTDKFKTKALEKYPLKLLILKRFIDDIFMILAHGEQGLQKFIEYLNNIHPTIKFTHEFSKTDVNILDTTVKIIIIIMYLYSAQYLHILQDSKRYLPIRLFRYSPNSQVTDIPLTGR